MSNYGLSLYGIATYGETDNETNLFFDWLPNAVRSTDINTQLERFCSLFSTIFWNEKKSIDGLLDLSDVEKVPIKYLSNLASLIIKADDYNHELPEDLQRVEVLNMPQMYKKKGIEESAKTNV